MKRFILRSNSRSPDRAIAFGLAGAFMLVPANFLPVLTTSTSGETRTDTIFTGIVALWERGLWAIGIIIFTASILVPLLKLLGLAWLVWAARRQTRGQPRTLTRWHARLDFIGRWSMLDVFLVTFLTGAVQFGAFASVQPRIGIAAFAAAVVLTMLATHAFDPRVFWERPGSIKPACSLPSS